MEDHLIESELQIIPKDEKKKPKTISHYHSTDWIDGYPGDPEKTAQLARIAMQDAQKKFLIHCVAGQGRTGTLASVISAYQRIKKENISLNVIKDTVIDLRKERMGCIRSAQQYLSVYDAVEVLLLEDGILRYKITNVST